MKKIYTLLSAVLLSASLWAQAPQSFSYQAVVRGANNALVIDKVVGMKVSILQGSENGTVVYSESHSSKSNSNGLLSVAIGTGNVLSGVFTKIDWSNGIYFIKTETDPLGGTAYALSSISQLLSVPFALHAKTAEIIVGGNTSINSGGYTHYIGEEFGGGVIFHLWKDKLGVEHGLVVSTTDQSIEQIWSNITNVDIVNTAKSSWDGLTNSNEIVGQASHTSSGAKLCLDLINGGLSDWYLPSIQELNILWSNYYTVVRTFSNILGATNLNSSCINCSFYWSSTSLSLDRAYCFSFNNGVIGESLKSESFHVRAIRAF